MNSFNDIGNLSIPPSPEMSHASESRERRLDAIQQNRPNSPGGGRNGGGRNAYREQKRYFELANLTADLQQLKQAAMHPTVLLGRITDQEAGGRRGDPRAQPNTDIAG